MDISVRCETSVRFEEEMLLLANERSAIDLEVSKSGSLPMATDNETCLGLWLSSELLLNTTSRSVG